MKIQLQPFSLKYLVAALLLTFILFASVPKALATHIVGGEMELTHLGGNTYRLGLIIYFDDVNGQPGARDNTVDISVFRKADDALMETFLLPLRTDEFVEYTDPDCARGDLRTRKIYYSLSIFLPPDVFNHPDGYYLVHERCCRNGGIGNIVAPQDAAQAFYLEIPPVVKNGEPFINNSPPAFSPAQRLRMY